MSSQIGDRQAPAEGRAEQGIVVTHQIVHLSHEQGPGPLRTDVLNRWNETGRSKSVGPVTEPLPCELVNTTVAGQIIERRPRLGSENQSERIGRKLREINRLKRDSGVAKCVQRI